jgi:hypothetical protein
LCRRKYLVKKTLLLSFIALGSMAFAASNTAKVNLLRDSIIEGKTLKAGEYKVSVENGTAVLKRGKESIEVPAREETAPSRFSETELTYKDDTNLEEIHLGGTHTKIVFEGAAPEHSTQ